MKATYYSNYIEIHGKTSEADKIKKVAAYLINKSGYEDTKCGDDDCEGQMWITLKTFTTVAESKVDYKLAKGSL